MGHAQGRGLSQKGRPNALQRRQRALEGGSWRELILGYEVNQCPHPSCVPSQRQFSGYGDP
jgi:hypothetical protein